MDQKYFLRIANRRSAGLGIDHNRKCLFQVRFLVYIDMADACSCLDNRHSGIFYHCLNEPRPTARYQEVNLTLGSHQLSGRDTTGILDQFDHFWRNSSLLQTSLEGGHNGLGRLKGLLASPQNNSISALNSQGCRIGGDIWTTLINHANQTKGNGFLADHHTIWGSRLLQEQTNWIWQGNQGPNPSSHVSNPLLIQEQAI